MAKGVGTGSWRRLQQGRVGRDRFTYMCYLCSVHGRVNGPWTRPV